jgi:MoxR-like ATPase
LANTIIHLGAVPGKPVLIEGPAGTGKTVARSESVP